MTTTSSTSFEHPPQSPGEYAESVNLAFILDGTSRELVRKHLELAFTVGERAGISAARSVMEQEIMRHDPLRVLAQRHGLALPEWI